MRPDFPRVVEQHAAQRPDRPAFLSAGTRISYAALDAQVNRVANSLLAMGLARGDHIATVLPQSPAFVTTYLAAGKTGLVVVPLDPRLKTVEMKSLCERTRPRALVALATPEPLKRGVNALMNEYAFERVFSLGGLFDDPTARPFEDLLSGSDEPIADRLRPGGNDAWVVIFTSGTTGRPKGAVLSHANSWALAEATARQWRIDTTDISLCNLPTSHVGGTHNQLAVSLYAGSTGILVPKFDPIETLELVARHRVTYFGGVPTMFRLMFRSCDPRDFDTSSVRAVVTAGEPASAELIRQIAAAFPGAAIVASWGMSETAGFFTFTGLEDDPTIVEQTEGRPDPTFEMKILDADGTPRASGEVGEIWVRGESVIRSYMDEADNEGAFSGSWLRTGDLGFLDDAGYLHFAGRAKEMYISGGYNVYPLEIESFLNAYPGVNTSAVIEVPHDVWGEVGLAFVVPEQGAALAADDLEPYCREGLADYKRPAKIIVETDLPRSLIGKIAKRELRNNLARYFDRDAVAGG